MESLIDHIWAAELLKNVYVCVWGSACMHTIDLPVDKETGVKGASDALELELQLVVSRLRGTASVLNLWAISSANRLFRKALQTLSSCAMQAMTLN